VEVSGKQSLGGHRLTMRLVLLFDDPYFTYPDTYGNSSMGVIADDDILGNIGE